MSFDEFAKRIAGTPEAAAGAAARAAELARKPFAEAFVSEVYPHWQGPLKSISGKQGVESVTHGHVVGFVPVASMGGVIQTLEEPLLSEVLTVATHVGVRAVVAYVFTGSPDDAGVQRVAGYVEQTELVLATEGPASPVHLARGPVAALMAALVTDVPAASQLFGLLLVAGLEARQDRLTREEAAREAEEKRSAEQTAAEEKSKAEEVERQKTAALAESQRLERESRSPAPDPEE